MRFSEELDSNQNISLYIIYNSIFKTPCKIVADDILKKKKKKKKTFQKKIRQHFIWLAAVQTIHM